jgi:hypothetical protein
MRKELIQKIAEICEADEDQLVEEIHKYGIRDFFARLDFLDYPAATKAKLVDLHRYLRLSEKEER